VTLAFATYRGFPWKKVPVRGMPLRLMLKFIMIQIYIFAQVMGGLVGAALVYANYIHAIDIVEGGRGVRTLTTASLFSTYAVGALSVAMAMFVVLINILDELHDECLCFFLGVSRHCGTCGTCLRYDRQEKYGPASRSRSFVLVSCDSRHRSIPRNGNW
jgi:glycerol uptake facilitator-like aquaporin